jgi:hypothetical protein
MPRRFPPPWSVEEADAWFIVRDANGQARAYFYYDDEPHRSSINKRLTKPSNAFAIRRRAGSRQLSGWSAD